MQFKALAVAALLSVAHAVDVQVVAVGKNPSKNETALKFFPDNIQAKPGTMVQFQFWAGNHTVTQSNFDNPCIPINQINSSIAGIYSSFQPVAASASMGQIPVFTVMINDTKPVWLFCSQGTHCKGGMSMVINENTQANATRSLDNYQKMAAAASGGSNSGGGGYGSSPSSSSGPSTPSTVGSVGAKLSAPGALLLALGTGFMLL